MIKGLATAAKNPLEMMLDYLQASHIEFHLTGSRAFSKLDVTPTSDYDFFTSYNQENQKWLVDRGFQCLSPKVMEYAGLEEQGLILIYRKTFPRLPHIDVQLVSDVQKKLKAQLILQTFQFYLKDSLKHKSVRRGLWEQAFALAS